MVARKISVKVAFLFFFTGLFIAATPCLTLSAPPGIELFSDGLGVATWSTNAASPFTALEHWVKIIDYDGIASGGTSHTVTVTYPDTSVKTLQYRYHANSYSAFYEIYDTSISQPINPATYDGTYTYRVTRVAGGEYGEATDDLQVNPVTPLNETTFTPGLPGPQSVNAYFDNVYTNGSLYDEFASGFDPTKWQSQPPEATYDGGELRFQKTWNTSTGAIWMRMQNPAGVNSLKATVRLTDFSGTDPVPRVRIGGYFCHLPEGEVHANIGLQGNEAVYVVAVERWEGNHYISQPLFPITTLGPVTQGNNYELSIEWNGTSQFTFRVAGLNDSVSYSANYNVSGSITPANNPWKGISIIAFSYPNTTTPTFSWTEVPGATYYRVRIYGQNDTSLYAGYTTSPPFTLPPGILRPYGIYKYRIEAINDHQWFEWDNAAVGDRNKTLFLVDAFDEAPAPYIDLFANGVLTWTHTASPNSTSLYAKIHDAQGVPSNIDSVKVLFPDGSTELSMYLDYNETSTCGIYRGVYWGSTIQSGTYTFTVEDKDGNTFTISEDLTPNPIGYPSEASLVPAHNTVLGGTEVSFDWENVTGAAYYEIQLYDKNLATLYYLRTTDSQYTLPSGLLKENQLYNYRVKAYREFPEESIDNGSEIPWYPLCNNFFTTSITGGTASPALDLVNHGVVVFSAPHPITGAPGYQLAIMAKVTDLDGVPENIQKVEVTYPDLTTKLLKYFDDPAFGSNYSYQEFFTDYASIQSGTYTIRAYDFDGNFAEITDTIADVSSNVLASPTNVTPPNDVFLNDNTPTITWSPVNGASYYKVRIFDSWGSDTTVHWSPELTQAQYTVPAEILATNTTYAYRVYAYRGPIGYQVDFVSAHVSFHSLNYHFTTGALDGEAGTSISGTVYESDGITPLTGVNLRVVAYTGSPCGQIWEAGSGMIDSNGNYTISNLSPGTYYLRSDHMNQSNYVREWWDNLGSTPYCGNAQAIVLSSGQMEDNKDFQLDLGGTISGQVVGDDGPIEGMMVQVFSGGCWNGWLGNDITDGNGEYLIERLPPLPVYVVAQAEVSHLNYVTEWYDDTIFCQIATPVTVVSNDGQPNIDFTLSRGPKRVRSYEVIVGTGNLNPFFWVEPGFRDELVSATLTMPNTTRGSGGVYTFDLTNDKILWSSECRYIHGWQKNFGPVEPADYGIYTFNLQFQDGAQEIYTYTIQDVAITAVSDIFLAVNDDGSARVTWNRNTSVLDHYYEVRVRDLSGQQEIFKSQSYKNIQELNIPATDLRCLEIGTTYRWLVRVYDNVYPLYSKHHTEYVEASYAPIGLTNRVTSANVYKWNGRLALQFDVRPGSRDYVKAASVTGPEGFFYPFNIINDWIDISTETRINKTWFKQDAAWPITNGTYTFTIEYDDDLNGTTDHMEEINRSLSVDADAPVAGSGMEAFIYLDGAMRFSWGLTGIPGLKYQVRLRSQDGSEEYYSSNQFTDGTTVTANFSDLRAMKSGQTYQWFVRAWSTDGDTMEQSAPAFFLYDPFVDLIPGDVNGNGKVDLGDAIMALQIVVGMSPEGFHAGRDVNGDGKIGVQEVIYILQEIGGLR